MFSVNNSLHKGGGVRPQPFFRYGSMGRVKYLPLDMVRTLKKVLKGSMCFGYYGDTAVVKVIVCCKFSHSV